MTDIKYKETQNQRFHGSLRKNMVEATGPKRTEIDVIRTAIWYAQVKQKLSANTAYEIERKLEPNAFGFNKYHDEYHTNKWSKYQVGERTPNKALIASVDCQLSGTQYLIDHVLWKCLKVDINGAFDVDSWIKELRPNIQQVIFEDSFPNVVGGVRRIKFSEVQLKMLERKAGIEALACLMILFHESYSEGNYERALDIGISLYRVLLIACNTLPFKHFTTELFYIFDKKVFSQIDANGLGFRFDEFNFVEAVELLNTLLLVIEDSNQSVSSLDTMIKLIDGGHGFDIMCVLRAPIGPVNPESKSNQKLSQKFKMQEKLRTWGRENLSSSNRAKFPQANLHIV
ncbi:MAG: hypothetical protein Q7U33_00015 [Methylotenera sp.]|uniref:hypothetical protein n=1 Tax=Methylotenera sp. TaxID=2051956 RepID=UPI002727A8B3|nr:hypothetical protein [Methylotenera sp.]MDO9149743.1 hypothetical protein [Methylotenera sp.]